MHSRRLAAILSALWIIVVLLGSHYGPEAFPALRPLMLLLHVMVLALVAASAWGWGALALRWMRWGGGIGGAEVQRALFEVGAGLGALAMLVFAMAAAGFLYRPAALAVLGAGVALLPMLKGRLPSPPREAVSWSGTDAALLALLGGCGLATLAAALAPPEFYDTLIYHLAVPDLYVRHHAMVPISGNYYSHFPANMGMLYALGLLLAGGELAQALHWLCGALSVAALYTMARPRTDRLTALLAAALLALAPGVMLVSTWAIADLAVMLFATLCFAAVLSAIETEERQWFILAGLFAGLALGTKYTAALVVCAPALLALLLAGPGRRRRFADAALFCLVAILVLSPWVARNVAFTGNPLAPYFMGDAASPDVADEMARRLPRDAGTWAMLWHYLGAPWHVTTRRLGAGGYLGAAFLALIPLLLFARERPRVVRPVAIIAGSAAALWALSSQVARYLMPVLPLCALLAAVAARRTARVVAIPLIAWTALYNIFLFVFLIETIGTWRATTGAIERDEYLARRVSYYPAVEYLNNLPGERVKVLFVGEGRGFYCRRPYVASTPFDTPALELYAARDGDEAALRARLREEGFTHLLVSGPELRRTRDSSADGEMKAWFPSGSLPLLFERGDVRVYALDEAD